MSFKNDKTETLKNILKKTLKWVRIASWSWLIVYESTIITSKYYYDRGASMESLSNVPRKLLGSLKLVKNQVAR